MNGLRYLGNAQVKINGVIVARKKGDVINADDIPDDAYLYLLGRPDFEAVVSTGSEAPTVELPPNDTLEIEED